MLTTSSSRRNLTETDTFRAAGKGVRAAHEHERHMVRSATREGDRKVRATKMSVLSPRNKELVNLVESQFPPAPRGLKGRTSELATLVRTVESTRPTRVALVGTGGSGKSMLAAALGHRLKASFEGRVDWFRVGAWDFQTLTEMLALRFGIARDEARVKRLQQFLAAEERLIVLDNHEDDRAMARLLQTFAKSKATFVITARRCLLAGVLVFPVTAPLVTSGTSAFPRVAKLTRLLRWNPLALDIADSIVGSRAASVRELSEYLSEAGVDRVSAMSHEDDLPEIALLVDWAWARLSPDARRILGVLAHVEGDNVDPESLSRLAKLRSSPAKPLEELARFHLVQEPISGRYTLHAVVRHALSRRTHAAPERVFEHYVSMIERDPERFALEQTHLFAAMDYAYRESDMSRILRVDALMRRLEGVED